MNACHAAGEAVLMCLEDAEGAVNTARAQQLPAWTAQAGTPFPPQMAWRAELSPSTLLGEFHETSFSQVAALMSSSEVKFW